MPPLRLIKSVSPLATTAANSIAKSSFSSAAAKQPQMSIILPSPTTAAMAMSYCSRRLVRNQVDCWVLPRIIAAGGASRHRHASRMASFQFRHQSSFRNTKNNSTKSSSSSSSTNTNTTSSSSASNNTLSTLSNIFAAGIGTFASTLAALYLATIVETSAHEFLYEYFPHWYGDIPTEALPHCLLNREMARRVTGLVVLNRSRGVGMEGADEESMMLMGMDGWMEQPDLGQDNNNNNSNNNMMTGTDVAQQEEYNCEKHHRLKHPQETRTVSSTSTLPSSSSTWERRMMDNRARIIENEEREFVRGFNPFSTTTTSSSSGKNTNRFMEKVQAEASRKFQEQLASVAMTA